METISFLSNTVTKPINRLLKGYECFHFDINTIPQTLSKAIKSDYLIIILDINYYSNDGFLDDSASIKLDELSDLLKLFRQKNKTKIIFANVFGHFLDINSKLNIYQYQKLLDLNANIEELVKINDFAILNIYQLANNIGYKNFYNLNNSFLFQTPWTKTAFSSMAIAIKEKFELFNVTRKKLLVLDADNTLWGGIIGEDGIDNISIDDNYPGIIYRFFQQQIKHLKNSGLLLAMVSKNNVVDVHEVFKNKRMPLQWDDFICKEINWQPKSQNIKAIIEKLNIGLESVIFLDDDTFEIEEVSNTLDIDVIKVSVGNPIENLSIFDNLLSVKTLHTTSDDKEKTYQYKTQEKRLQNKKLFKSVEDYLRSIDMKVKMYINNTSQLKRIVQLTNKVNQFNLTTQRYSESEVFEIMQEHQVFSFSLEDKFGDLGIVAVVIVKYNNIDSFLLSCRALSRNLEQKILYLVSNNTKLPLTAIYKKTIKNSQASYFYDEFSLKTIVHDDTKIYELAKEINNIDYIEDK